MSFYFFLKRTVDIFGSVAGILAIALVFPFVAIAIKLDSKGPIFIKLDRVSNGKTIKAHKFRSMIVSAHLMKKGLAHLNERKDGPFFKIKNDPRVTKTGRILRKIHLDEFPQFFNVLKGELSLIGPRPHEPEEVKNYPEEYRHLIYEKAGVTGLSQISGASDLPFLKELELDSFYIKNRSFWLDLKILLKTLVILFTEPKGI